MSGPVKRSDYDQSGAPHAPQKWGDTYPVGALVRCVDPDEFMADTARKLRNRVGMVEGHQMWSRFPIVKFAKAGNRKEFKWVPSPPQWIELAS